MKIFYKLFIGFIVLGVVPFIGYGFFSFEQFYKFVIREESKVLQGVLQEKVKILNNFFYKFMNNANLIAHSPSLNQFLSSTIQKKTDLENQVKPFLHYLALESKIANALIISKNGTLILGTGKFEQCQCNLLNDQIQDPLLLNCIKKTFKTGVSTISDFFYSPLVDENAIYVASPIKKDKELIGCLILQIPENQIFDIFKDYTLLGNTGESLVAMQSENKILFITPIRHYPNSAFNLSIDFDSKLATPMQQALKHNMGHGIMVDYRGKKVLAAWTYYPLMNWGLVIKMDLAEVLKPLLKMSLYLILVAFVIVTLIIIGIIIFSKKITRPLKILGEAVEQLKFGNLDKTIPIKSHDEIAVLATGINEMAAGLKQSMTSIENLNMEIAQRKEAEKAKAEFISIISHELRTPISPIKEGISLVLEEKVGRLNDEQKELLNIADKNSTRLHLFINQILDFQKLEAQKTPFRFNQCNINDLLNEVYEMFKTSATKKQIELNLQLSKDLPFVFCDKDKILEVLINFLGNAFEYTKEGSITLISSLKGENIEVEIKDTGIGIYEEDIPKLFETFKQLNDKRLASRKGTGLGLAICKKIINFHKGEIWVRSEIDKGSSFYFSLPINKEKNT